MARFTGIVEALNYSGHHEAAVENGYKGDLAQYIKDLKLSTVCIAFDHAVNFGEREAYMGFPSAEVLATHDLKDGDRVSGECEIQQIEAESPDGSCMVVRLD
jgi:hypothetical protein